MMGVEMKDGLRDNASRRGGEVYIRRIHPLKCDQERIHPLKCDQERIHPWNFGIERETTGSNTRHRSQAGCSGRMSRHQPCQTRRQVHGDCMERVLCPRTRPARSHRIEFSITHTGRSPKRMMGRDSRATLTARVIVHVI